MKKIILLIVLVSILGGVYAQLQPVALFDFVSYQNDREGKYIKLRLKTEFLKKIYEADMPIITLSIPKGNGESYVLELAQANLLADNFELVAINDKGKRPIPYEKGRYYQGRLLAQEKSIAGISIFRNEVIGVFSDDNGNINLGRLGNSEDEYILYNDKEMNFPLKFNCGAGNNSGTPTAMSEGGGETRGKCVMVWFDCDNDLYQLKGSSVWATANHVTGLYNIVSTIYQNDPNTSVSTKILSIYVWTSPDPFLETTSNAALGSYETYQSSTNPPLFPAIYHLLARDGSGFGNGGIAYLEGFCSTNPTKSFAYSDILGYFYNFPTYSQDLTMVAHENGHSLGSHHTQWCGWNGGALDDCYTTEGGCLPGPTPINGGTIMSYCHLASSGINLSNGFGLQPGTVIKNYVNASCAPTCSCPSNTIVSFYTFNPQTPAIINKTEVSNTITSYNLTLNANTYTKFDAGSSITLQPGFWAKNGATFHAYIDGCGTADDYVGISTPQNIVSYEFVIYPNPNNGFAKFEYTLPQNENISISIVNYTGQEVANPIKNENCIKGKYFYLFENQLLTSGIYFVILKTEKQIITQKMIIHE